MRVLRQEGYLVEIVCTICHRLVIARSSSSYCSACRRLTCHPKIQKEQRQMRIKWCDWRIEYPRRRKKQRVSDVAVQRRPKKKVELGLFGILDRK